MVKIHPLWGLFLLSFALVGIAAANPTKKYVGVYELKKGNFSVKITNWGATVLSVILPDSKGRLADVVLGYEKFASYLNNSAHFGAIVGRVANRIAGAQFTINGIRYHLVPNEGKNTLHGGRRGFDRVIWTVKDSNYGNFPYIKLSYHSFDGEQGFPGDLDVSVTYKLVGDYVLSVSMKAKARNKPTPVNLAQHTYWNLGGYDSGDILSHTLQLFASRYTPVDSSLIPTGQIASVHGTPYDFLRPQTIGSRIAELPSGYDINYALDHHQGAATSDHGMQRAAVLKDGRSGREMELWTDAPGLQLYTSNSLRAVVGKRGYVYEPHAAVCLETQGFPDAVNHPNFPSQIVNPGEIYKHHMLYKFSF